ncbi:MAG: hypothetical protein MRJ93_00075 [Nitrososphaeraceae archaeon]|nr:hypothetical protein [Nitrososphaeraceae archaeon]
MSTNIINNKHDDNFLKQITVLKERIRDDKTRFDPLFQVGTEIEACLLDSNAQPVHAKSLINELSEFPFFKKTGCMIDYEYGTCQFEFKTPPLSFSDLSNLESLYEEFILDNLTKSVKRVYPNKEVIPVFLGANPSPSVLDDKIVNDFARYRELFDWQNKFQDIELEGNYFRPPHIPAAIQGFHFHLQGRNPNHVSKMFNHILNLIPSVIVLGASSKLFAGKIYSYHEPRIYLYDHSEQQNSGFPSIPRYLDSLEDYINYIISKKGILAKDYFDLEKDRHDDVRIRLNSKFYRVETRIASVQASPKALMAMIEFFVGYIYYAIMAEEQGNQLLRPLQALREERTMAVISGYEAKSHYNITDTIELQLDYAKKGLNELNLKPDFLDILDRRLKNKVSPSEFVANKWYETFDGSIEKTIYKIITEIWERTKNNNPIY